MPVINRTPRRSDEAMNLTCRLCDWSQTVHGYERARGVLAGHVGEKHPEVSRGGGSSFSPLPAVDAPRRLPPPRLTDGIEHPVTTRRVEPRS
ncbi:hypothetical protein QDA09_gp55 [Microbacterium phage Tyrumbra]|uniref:Uncharacterized protein n=1 Tax=Microbacterium phage Tyrumbra TaxID=2596974 RepID=A0A516KPI0_9CAUD|nr:hypothetical protein QDA09_gp55 [Microbacterium phage Tyrumbra]QDP43592.1 hypothetical protein SEA_TYRUMBRA_55 [Microbacterium phage Tyrumbra]